MNNDFLDFFIFFKIVIHQRRRYHIRGQFLPKVHSPPLCLFLISLSFSKLTSVLFYSLFSLPFALTLYLFLFLLAPFSATSIPSPRRLRLLRCFLHSLPLCRTSSSIPAISFLSSATFPSLPSQSASHCCLHGVVMVTMATDFKWRVAHRTRTVCVWVWGRGGGGWEG